jgi:glucoamylase
MESLEDWLTHEYRYAAGAMLQSVSPTRLVKSRPGFGHEIRAVKGAIVASPVLASWDPDPDYFFHWYRDSAVVIDALRLLFEDETVGTEALTHVADFTRFTLSLSRADGRELVAGASWRAKVTEDFTKYVRDDAELSACYGDSIAAETRVNPDGTLDISKWCRPQHDGPPLRALALLRWIGTGTLDVSVVAEVSELIRADLAFTHARWREPSFDIWEEDIGQHFYNVCVSGAALSEGANWLEARGDHERARAYRTESETIRRTLEEFWLPDAGYYRSRILPSGARSTKDLDIAVILAAIHAGGDRVHDPRMQATLERLDALFDVAYLINHNRPRERGPALGRYGGDTYFSGGAWYVSTLGAAEFCFRAAAGRNDAPIWVEKGDAYLATVRAFTPPGGELSEQFDQRTGSQTSAKHLAWSYAAFISCVRARRMLAGASRPGARGAR